MWMVVLILFRDIFITILRIIMKRNGYALKTSRIAKSKTAVQLTLIISILIFLSFNGHNVDKTSFAITFIINNNIIYNATFAVCLFTLYTGFRYLQNNYDLIRNILGNENTN